MTKMLGLKKPQYIVYYYEANVIGEISIISISLSTA